MQTVFGAVRPHLTDQPPQARTANVSIAARAARKKHQRRVGGVTLGVTLLLLLAILALVTYSQRNNTLASARFFISFVIYLCIAAVGIVLRRTDDALDPFLAVVFLYSAYSWSAIWSVEISGKEVFPDDVLLTYYLCIASGLISFMLAYCYAVSERHPLHRAVLPVPRPRTFYQLCLAATLIAGVLDRDHLARVFDPRQILAYTDAAAAWRKEALVDQFSGLKGMGEMFTDTLLMACLLLPTFTKRKFGVLGFSLAGIWAVLSVKGGSKGVVLTVILTALIYRHYYVRPVRLRSLLVLSVLLYFPLTMLTHVRNTTSLVLMGSNAVDLVRADESVLSPASNGELAGPPVSLLRVIDAIDSGQLAYSYGKTYLSELSTFLPRAIYPDRPLPLSLRYMATFYPGEMEQGRGMGFFIPTEGYWAFGLAGVCLQMAAFGAILGTLYRSFRANLNNRIIAFIYVMIWMPGIVTPIRTGLIGSVKATLMVVAPLLLLYLLTGLRRSPGPNRTPPRFSTP